MPADSRAERVGGRVPAAGRFRARAFGLEIDAGFEAPGLPPAHGAARGPAVRLELGTPEEIARDGPAEGARRVLEERFEDDGPPARTIDVHPDHGYRLYARHFGLARISPSGAEVACAPPDGEPGG